MAGRAPAGRFVTAAGWRRGAGSFAMRRSKTCADLRLSTPAGPLAELPPPVACHTLCCCREVSLALNRPRARPRLSPSVHIPPSADGLTRICCSCATARDRRKIENEKRRKAGEEEEQRQQAAAAALEGGSAAAAAEGGAAAPRRQADPPAPPQQSPGMLAPQVGVLAAHAQPCKYGHVMHCVHL